MLKDSEMNLDGEVCRLCLGTDNLLWIFDERILEPSHMKEVIYITTGVQIKDTDTVTQKICINCYELIYTMFRFRTEATKNNQGLKNNLSETLQQVDKRKSDYIDDNGNLLLDIMDDVTKDKPESQATLKIKDPSATRLQKSSSLKSKSQDTVISIVPPENITKVKRKRRDEKISNTCMNSNIDLQITPIESDDNILETKKKKKRPHLKKQKNEKNHKDQMSEKVTKRPSIVTINYNVNRHITSIESDTNILVSEKRETQTPLKKQKAKKNEDKKSEKITKCTSIVAMNSNADLQITTIEPDAKILVNKKKEPQTPMKKQKAKTKLEDQTSEKVTKCTSISATSDIKKSRCPLEVPLEICDLTSDDDHGGNDDVIVIDKTKNKTTARELQTDSTDRRHLAQKPKLPPTPDAIRKKRKFSSNSLHSTGSDDEFPTKSECSITSVLKASDTNLSSDQSKVIKVCKMCSFVSYSSNQLKIHSRIHMLCCPLCKAKFQSSDVKTYHLEKQCPMQLIIKNPPTIPLVRAEEMKSLVTKYPDTFRAIFGTQKSCDIIKAVIDVDNEVWCISDDESVLPPMEQNFIEKCPTVEQNFNSDAEDETTKKCSRQTGIKKGRCNESTNNQKSSTSDESSSDTVKQFAFRQSVIIERPKGIKPQVSLEDDPFFDAKEFASSETDFVKNLLKREAEFEPSNVQISVEGDEEKVYSLKGVKTCVKRFRIPINVGHSSIIEVHVDRNPLSPVVYDKKMWNPNHANILRKLAMMQINKKVTLMHDSINCTSTNTKNICNSSKNTAPSISSTNDAQSYGHISSQVNPHIGPDSTGPSHISSTVVSDTIQQPTLASPAFNNCNKYQTLLNHLQYPDTHIRYASNSESPNNIPISSNNQSSLRSSGFSNSVNSNSGISTWTNNASYSAPQTNQRFTTPDSELLNDLSNYLTYTNSQLNENGMMNSTLPNPLPTPALLTNGHTTQVTQQPKALNLRLPNNNTGSTYGQMPLNYSVDPITRSTYPQTPQADTVNSLPPISPLSNYSSSSRSPSNLPNHHASPNSQIPNASLRYPVYPTQQQISQHLSTDSTVHIGITSKQPLQQPINLALPNNHPQSSGFSNHIPVSNSQNPQSAGLNSALPKAHGEHLVHPGNGPTYQTFYNQYIIQRNVHVSNGKRQTSTSKKASWVTNNTSSQHVLNVNRQSNVPPNVCITPHPYGAVYTNNAVNSSSQQTNYVTNAWNNNTSSQVMNRSAVTTWMPPTELPNNPVNHNQTNSVNSQRWVYPTVATSKSVNHGKTDGHASPTYGPQAGPSNNSVDQEKTSIPNPQIWIPQGEPQPSYTQHHRAANSSNHSTWPYYSSQPNNQINGTVNSRVTNTTSYVQ